MKATPLFSLLVLVIVFKSTITHAQDYILSAIVHESFHKNVEVRTEYGISMPIEEFYGKLVTRDTIGEYGYSCLFQDLRFSGYSLVIASSWHQAESILTPDKDSIDIFKTLFDDNDNFLFRYHLFQLANNYADSSERLELSPVEKSIASAQTYWKIDSLYNNGNRIPSSKCISSYQLRLSSDKTYVQDFVGQSNPCFDQNMIMHDHPFWGPEENDKVQYVLGQPGGRWKVTNQVLYLLGDNHGGILAYPIDHIDDKHLVLSPSKDELIYLSKVFTTDQK